MDIIDFWAWAFSLHICKSFRAALTAHRRLFFFLGPRSRPPLPPAVSLTLAATRRKDRSVLHSAKKPKTPAVQLTVATSDDWMFSFDEGVASAKGEDNVEVWRNSRPCAMNILTGHLMGLYGFHANAIQRKDTDAVNAFAVVNTHCGVFGSLKAAFELGASLAEFSNDLKCVALLNGVIGGSTQAMLISMHAQVEAKGVATRAGPVTAPTGPTSFAKSTFFGVVKTFVKKRLFENMLALGDLSPADLLNGVRRSPTILPDTSPAQICAGHRRA